MRRVWAAQTILAVLVALVAAPLVHLHTGEKHDHDGRPLHEHKTIIHAHLPEARVVPTSAGYHPGELSHASHDAKPVEVVAIVHSDSQVLAQPFVAAGRIKIVPLLVSIERFVLQAAPRTHDPPLLEPTSPRAPPA